MTEKWAPVREFPDHYEVSSLGRLRRINAYRPNHEGKIRKPQIARNGYVVYMLSVENTFLLRTAHRMVADAFLGPIPPKMQVNHKNGDKSDPSLENLEIVTAGENRSHAYRTLGVEPNRPPSGINNVNARLTYREVTLIREKYADGGVSYSNLAAEYGTTKQTIARIVKRQTRLAA